MLEVSAVFLGIFLGFFVFLKGKRIDYPVVFSLALTPAVISVLFYFTYLFAPGNSLLFYKTVVFLFSFVFLALSLFFYGKKVNFADIKFDFAFLIPLAVSCLIFFYIPRFFSDYDPLNYAIIGKTIFKMGSISLYPFVEQGAKRPVFSYFYHPPILSLIYSFLYIFKVQFLMFFVGGYFYSVLNLFVFSFFKKNSGIVVAFFALVLIAFSPGFVELSKAGFTGSVRMLFFALSFYYVSRYSLFSVPVVLSGAFALFSHSIGLLILPMLFFAELLKDGKLDFKKHFFAFALIGFLGGTQYLLNLIKFHALDVRGYLLGFYGIIGKHYIDYQFLERGLSGLIPRIKNGYFDFFFNFKMFALSFWIVLPLYLIAVYKFFKKNLMVKISTVFVGIYFVLHFSPLKSGIFIMSYRYVYTIFPIMLMSVYPLLQESFFKILFVYFAYLNTVFVFLFANPFYHKKFWYGEMKSFISNRLNSRDKVLTNNMPSFYFYNDNIPGKDVMDPDMEEFYHVKDIYHAMLFLKKNGFTHILMPYKPDPFATDTFLEEIFKYPFLVIPEKTYYNCSLFRINYSSLQLLKQKPRIVFEWDGKSRLPVVFYKNKKDAKGKIRFEFTENGLKVYSENKGFIFMFARGKAWQKDCCYIELKESNWIKFDFRADSVSDSRKILPFIHLCFQDKGKNVGLKWVKVKDGYKAMANSPYFRVLTDFINVSEAKSIAFGVNFYSGGGTVEFREIKVEIF